LSKPIIKKEPMTVNILNTMYDNKFDKNNLMNMRIINICLLSYAGFLRSSEVLHLVRSDIQIFHTQMTLFIQYSKTDVYKNL